MESFLFALGAVMPIILMVALGYFLKRIGLLGGATVKAVNKLVFRVLLPCLLFLNIYKIENVGGIDTLYIWFCVAAVLITFFAAIPLSRLVTDKRGQRGVIIQASFRSNYALIGIPLATSLYGDDGAAIATLLSAISIPLYNVLSVITLSIFGDGGKVSAKKVIVGILTNPLIDSIALGVLCLGVRAIFAEQGISWRVSDITPLYTVVSQLSAAATPVALLMLGAQFELSAIPTLKKQIIFGTATRTLIVPAVALCAAYFLGCFSGAHFAAFIGLFATSVAISSVPMAQEMGADAELAGQFVVWTTIVSAFTIFLFSFILKEIGVFA